MTNLTLTTTATPQQDNIQDLIFRLEKIKLNCFKTPNPYYQKNIQPTEYQDLVSKIKELKKLTING